MATVPIEARVGTRKTNGPGRQRSKRIFRGLSVLAWLWSSVMAITMPGSSFYNGLDFLLGRLK